MRRLICRLLGHAKPVAKTRRGHLLNGDWTFGRETWVVEYSCSRCGEWLATEAAKRMQEALG